MSLLALQGRKRGEGKGEGERVNVRKMFDDSTQPPLLPQTTDDDLDSKVGEIVIIPWKAELLYFVCCEKAVSGV